MPTRRKKKPKFETVYAGIALGIIVVLLVVLAVVLPTEKQEPLGDELADELPLGDSAPAEEDLLEDSTPFEADPIPWLREDSEGTESDTKPLVAPTELPIPEGPGRIVIVIDDVGYDAGLLTPFLKIPVPISYAVLPKTRDSVLSAQLLSGAGKEVILHLPMETVSGTDPGPGTLWSRLGDDELRQLLVENIESVPGLVGINNHMGSLGTQDERVLGIVLEEVSRRGLFFLDSRTTSATKVPELAQQFGINYLERHVFLDNETDRAHMRQALVEGLTSAKENGYAVMIGHVWTEELAELVLELYPEILEQGFDFVSLGDLLREGIRPR